MDRKWRLSASYGSVIVFAFVMQMSISTTQGRQPERRDGNPSCVSAQLRYPRIHPRATSIFVNWTHFEPNPDCLKHGATYTIRVAWAPENGESREQHIPAQRDSYTIDYLTPYTGVQINVSLVYTYGEGNKHYWNADPFDTRTRVSHPSVPRNFRVTDVREDGTMLEWDPPEIPNGPPDGYEYRVCKVKTCDVIPMLECSGFTETRRLSFLAKDLQPLEYYWVWLAAFNKEEIEKKRMTGGYASRCFKAAPKALEPVRDLQAECSAPETMDIAWKLPPDAKDIPDGYRLLLLGEVGAASEDREVDISTSCRGGECKYTLEHLKGGINYHFELFPHYKDVGPFGASLGYGGCFVRHSPPTKEIKLVNDPNLNKTEQPFEVPLDLFHDMQVTDPNVALLIAQDTEIENCEHPLNWVDAHSQDPVKCYFVVTVQADESPFCEPRGDIVRCVVGSDDAGHCRGVYCNGPLKVGVSYGIKLRAHYGEHYRVDSKPAFFTAGTPVAGSCSSRKGSIFLVFAVIIATPIIHVMVMTPSVAVRDKHKNDVIIRDDMTYMAKA